MLCVTTYDPMVRVLKHIVPVAPSAEAEAVTTYDPMVRVLKLAAVRAVAAVVGVLQPTTRW